MGGQVLLKFLKKHYPEDIEIKDHAITRAQQRGINLKTIQKVLFNEEKLIFAQTQEAKRKNHKKFNAYFKVDKKYFLNIVLETNKNIYVITVRKVNIKKQKKVRYYVKI